MKLNPSTVNCHILAIIQLLKYAYDLKPDPKLFKLTKMSYFNQRQKNPKPAIQWSLDKVLKQLTSDRYCNSASPTDNFHKCLFLIALATGLRISQLKALIRGPSYLKFGNDHVSLAPHPKFIAKNERPNHKIDPILIPVWEENGNPHTLCPVNTLKKYVEKFKNWKPCV